MDFGKLPGLEEGQFAIEDRAIGMYEKFDDHTPPVNVRFDNPLVAWHGKMQAQAHPDGALPEEHFVKAGPWGR